MSSKVFFGDGLDFQLFFLEGFDSLFAFGTRVPDVRELPIRFIDHLSEIHWYSTSLPRKEKGPYVSPYEPSVLGFEIHACSCITAGV